MRKIGKMKFLRSLKKAGCRNKVKRLEITSSKIVFVFFENEDDTNEVYKLVENYKFKENLDFNVNIKSENLKLKLIEMLEDKSNVEDKKFINDTENYKPRNLVDEKQDRQDRPSLKYKLDFNNQYQFKKNSFVNKALNNNSNKRGSFNKFDDFKKIAENFYNMTEGKIKEKDQYYDNNRRTSKGKNQRNKKFESFVLPLNKNYKLSVNEKVDTNAIQNNELNHNENSNIAIKYQIIDITKIFLNMNLLHKNDKPKGFENNFIPQIMREKPRDILEYYKEKSIKIREKRANTLFVVNHRNSSYSKARHSTVNKQLKEFAADIDYKRRSRHGSLKYKHH